MFRPQSTSVRAALALLLLPSACSAFGLHRQAKPMPPAALHTLETRALAEAQAGKTDDAIRDYSLALTAQPDWKEGWWNLGSLQYDANHFADAKSTFSRVVQFAPDLGTAWALLGLSEFETKDLPAAQAHFERALSLGIDDDPEIRRVSTYHLALLLLRTSQFERASDLLSSISGAPGTTSPELRFAFGLALLRVPLLPAEVDPSHEALLSAAGDLALAGDASLARFPTFLAAHPDIPYAHYAYGLRLEKAGRNAEALTEMRAEARVSPASPLPWKEIVSLNRKLGKAAEAQANVHHLEALERTDEPEQRLVQQYGIATQSAIRTDALWGRAMQEYAAAQYPAAISDLKPLLQQQPANGTGWAVLGLSEYALNDFDDARIHLERGQALGLSGSAQSLREARYTLGLLLLRAGEFDRATSVLQSALKPNPQDSAILDALGLGLLHRIDRPTQILPADKELVRSAGDIAALLENSRYDEAFPLFKSLLEKYPRAPFLHYSYGTALLALSQFDQSALQMRLEIAVSPANPLPYLRLASIALRQHAPTDAVDPARKALALAPNSPEAHYLLGRALFESGDDAVALHELEIAGKLSPASPEVHFNLARAYARAKMPDAAATERATFARLNSISEQQRSRSGNQVYAGPHDTGDTMPVQPAATSTSNPE